MRRTLVLSLCLVFTSGCQLFEPAQEAPPALIPGAPAQIRETPPPMAPTPRPSGVTGPPVLPSSKASPLARGCPTPPSGVCCGIVFGSLQGTVQDPDGGAVEGATVRLRTTRGDLLGNCSDTAATVTARGEFAFNAVPFGLPLALDVLTPGFKPHRQDLAVPKGPLLRLTIQLQSP